MFTLAYKRGYSSDIFCNKLLLVVVVEGGADAVMNLFRMKLLKLRMVDINCYLPGLHTS